MKDWADDLAACLGMMFDAGALFDAGRVDRAAALFQRLHPRFGGDVRAKLRQQLGVLCERGAVEAIGGDVYRWLGGDGDGAAPATTARGDRGRAPTASTSSAARLRPTAASPPNYDQAASNVLSDDPAGEAPTAHVGRVTDVFAPEFAERVAPRTSGPAPAPASARRSEPSSPGGPRAKPPALPTGEQFEAELNRRFNDAAGAGREHVHVSAFELHRALAPYPAPVHRMGVCCAVMRGVMNDRDQALTNPPSGKDGPELLIKYALPR